MYGYSRTHRTYFAALAGLCFALFSVSSVAQQLPPGQGVSVDWSPTTSHWQTNGSTFRTPPGVTTSSSTSVGPVTRTPTGGVSQPMGSGITITSLERSAPLSSRLTGSLGAVRNAVSRCLINIPCGIAVTGATIGLQELFNRTNWNIINDEVVIPFTEYPEEPPFPVSHQRTASFQNPDQCGAIAVCGDQGSGSSFFGCRNRWDGSRLQAHTPLTSLSAVCFYTSDPDYPGPVTGFNPVSDQDIEDGVNDNYDFHPSDWDSISQGFNPNFPGNQIEITNSPTLSTPPVTTTHYDADGQPYEITETNIDYSFAPRPGTNPGPKPALDLEETTTTTSSTADGTVTGSKTTTTTRPAGDTTPGTGSGGGSTPDTPWPSFCDWASVVCGWLNWTQEGWDQEEPDLPQIIDFVPEGDFEVGGAGECPAPYTINLGWMLNTSLEVSYQPFCDFAGLVKPLFLAFCYLFAGVITVRSL